MKLKTIFGPIYIYVGFLPSAMFLLLNIIPYQHIIILML